MDVGRISLSFEFKGKLCAVSLSQEKLRILLKVAAGLDDDDKLKVVELDGEYKFHEIGKQ